MYETVRDWKTISLVQMTPNQYFAFHSVYGSVVGLIHNFSEDQRWTVKIRFGLYNQLRVVAVGLGFEEAVCRLRNELVMKGIVNET
jgi:hypothetical protein